jgi:ParB-like chromosome segregation protein Spo0J
MKKQLKTFATAEEIKEYHMFTDFDKQPINRVQWVPVDQLNANDYNPNHVLAQEMRLLKHSMLEQGWIQPVLVSKADDEDTYTIIDGFHRATLVKTDKHVFNMTNGFVPCVIMDMTVPERKMLTVRINRAKGSHSAVRMHEIVAGLVSEHGLPVDAIMRGIGATRHEVDTLLTENLFKKFDVDNTPYSEAWKPKD